MKWLENRWMIPLCLLFTLVAFAFTLSNTIAHAEEPADYEYWVIGESNDSEQVDETDSYPNFDIVDEKLPGEPNPNTETEDIPIGSSNEDIVIGDSSNDIPENEIVLGESDNATIGYSDLEDDNVLNELKAIRQNSDIILYGLIPLIIAFWVICKFCVWFYETFIESAL